MTKEIYDFASFKTSEEFVAWQNEAPRRIVSITPIMMSINAGAVDGDPGIKVEGTTTVGCFVVFAKAGVPSFL